MSAGLEWAAICWILSTMWWIADIGLSLRKMADKP